MLWCSDTGIKMEHYVLIWWVSLLQWIHAPESMVAYRYCKAQKFCLPLILWISRPQQIHKNNGPQIVPRLAIASHLWLKTERAVQKLQLLKAGIVLSYVSSRKRKSFFLFKLQWNLYDSWREWTEMSNWWVSHQSSCLRSYKSPVISQIPQNFADMLKFRGKRQIPWLGSKFCGPRKTVGPSYYSFNYSHLSQCADVLFSITSDI